MKRHGTIVSFVVLSISVCVGCLDRKPAPVCPVPIEVGTNTVTNASFDGVDLLAVVDNSSSMEQEQTVLTAGFYTLINSLVNPPADWPYPAVDNVRLAVVSSDMGLQYGDERTVEDSPVEFSDPACLADGTRGDDGTFRTIVAEGNVVTVLSEQIPCSMDGDQCPEGYTCTNGTCRSNDGTDLMVCPALEGSFVETTAATPNATFTAQSACLAVQGTKGCGIEQQLEASVRGLERPENQSFVVDSHVLAVIVVSDEEDCSIKDKGLFSTQDWLSSDYINVACNRTADNESHLFDVSRYREKLSAVKNNQSNAVIFAAVVGVPNDDRTCQGTGTELAASGCLDHPKMQFNVVPMADTPGFHFDPACVRYEDDGETLVTEARPGRRFVQTAQSFGDQGYVYSICNPNWSSAMTRIAELIARQMQPQCFSKKLDWESLDEIESAQYPGCENCGFAACDAVLDHFIASDAENTALCPAELYEGLTDEERARYENMITVTDVSSSGEVSGQRVSCPVPKIPAPIDCSRADTWADTQFADRPGWYYCEAAQGTADLNTCLDGSDNNNDGLTDCDDDQCSSCSLCGGPSTTCLEGCPYRVVFNQKAEAAARSGNLTVQCLQQFTFRDENCQEDSPRTCSDGVDNDGNGAYDCDATLLSGGADAHRADPNCCPMHEENGKCIPDLPRLLDNCGRSESLTDVTTSSDPSVAQYVSACVEQAEALHCSW